MVYEMRRPARRDRALPRRRRGAPSSTSTSTGCARSASGRAPSTTTAAGLRLRRGRAFRTVAVRAAAAHRRHRAAPQGRPLPVRARRRRRGSRSTATRPTTSRSPGSSSGCAPSGRRPGRSNRHRRLRRARLHPRADRRGQGDGPARPPRSDILAFTMPGFATSAGTKSNATRLCESLGVTFEELDIRPAARQMLGRPRPPVRRGEEVYDVTFENVQAGLRTDYLFRARQPARRHRARHRRPVRAGPGLVHLRRRRPDVALRRQHRRAEDPDAAPDPLGRVVGAVRRTGERRPARRSSTRRSPPSWCRSKEGEKSQSTEDSIGPYALQDFTLYHVLRRGYRPSKIAFLAGTPGPTPSAGDWPPGYPEGARPAYDLATIRRWLEVFVKRFFANQFKRSACPTGPRSSAGGSLSPRGDWRMPSDAGRAPGSPSWRPTSRSPDPRGQCWARHSSASRA